MRISDSKSYVFLAYPRTGSRTMRRVLDPWSNISGVHISEITADNPFYNHAPAWYVKKYMADIGRTFSDYFSFCFVRNPFSRVNSLYRHDCIFRKNRNKPLIGLEEFLDHTRHEVSRITLGSENRFFMPAPLRFFVNDTSGERIVSKVFRYEDMEDALEYLVDHLNLGFDLGEIPSIGRREGMEFHQKTMSRECIEMIEEIYRDEISEFGYVK